MAIDVTDATFETDVLAQSEKLPVIVDLWAPWCPGCEAAAPGLVQVFHKYRDRPVRFVSLTNTSRESAEKFVRQFAIPWPCGYGVVMAAHDDTAFRAASGHHVLAVHLPEGRIDFHVRLCAGLLH